MPTELMKALKTAYEAEKEGLRAYLKYAKQTKVGTGKNMFIQLALDEIDHMELIEKFTEKIMAGQPIEQVNVPKGRLSKFMPSTKDLKLAEKSELADEDALKVALTHEEKAMNFYINEASKATDPKVKDFFNKLADVEKKHFEIIKAEIDFMSRDGFWFDTQEFSVEEN
ncbi:ferritin family protein [Calditerrivibrio nitroreducens]|uniref:Rubrerythrin n=1 Tax=Calditerrivibrio nitroreducens (strain DSM 19672 / NBRC 101217 / Yu37-1) TaxID=768670 RepID=E4TGV3_CALNY|nr:ferritin family protein [Calditerrivibrio nitroreducens]ADR18713.1 Rubrerythrin [Calditerrivibrio nitroreducens DSM 19672]